jgi:pyruvate dehydrogenase E1 component beta subunit
MLQPVLKAVDQVQEARGASIEVIDLLTISPMDVDALAESVKKTGRCVVVQEAPRSFSASAEVIATLNDRALTYLEAPVKRVTGYDVVTPYFGRELQYLPEEKRIQRAIEETLDFV